MGVTAKRWTRDAYRQLALAGVLGEDDRVQLVKGEIVEMGPQGAAHAAVVHLVADALRNSVGAGYHVRVQSPLALGAHSEPEPDVAVVAGGPRDYLTDLPASAALVVEVADTTLEFDRTRKQEVYAEAGIAEYWIVNLVDGILEVYRAPQGSRFTEVLRLAPGDTVSPLAAPQSKIPVDALLP